MKHLYRFLILCSALLLLVLPHMVVAQEGEVYYEGFDVGHHGGHNIGSYHANVHAVKHVNGDWRQSDVHLDAGWGGDPPWQIRYYVDTTFTVPEDADWLEVSEDLGWAGLDVEVWIPMEVRTCTPTILDECTSTTETVLASIHLSGFADRPATQEGGEYHRYAAFTGTVTIGNRTFNGAWGYNFSDQYSEADWP